MCNQSSSKPQAKPTVSRLTTMLRCRLIWLQRLHCETNGAATLETIALAAIVAIFFIALLTVMQNRGHDVIAGRMDTNIDCQISLWRSGSNGDCGPGGLNPGEGNNGNVNNPTPTPTPADNGSDPSNDLQKIADCAAEFGLALVGEDGLWGDLKGLGELANDYYQFYNQLPSEEKLRLSFMPGGVAFAYVKAKIEQSAARISEIIAEISKHPELVEELKNSLINDPSLIFKVLFPDASDAYSNNQRCRLAGMGVYAIVPLKKLKALATLDKMTPNELVGVAKQIKCLRNSFSADTLVMTTNGFVPIAAIANGDLVLAYYEETGVNGYYPVIDTISHLDAEFIVLVIDGERIKTTYDHPFYTVVTASWLNHGESVSRWTVAGKLRPSDLIRRADGSFGKVGSIATVIKPQIMYNLTVNEAHTFFVGQGQWLVHNCIFSPKRLQKEFDKHAKDFSITGNWNKSNAELFRNAILDHISTASHKVTGTYRGTQKVTHYFDPATKRWAAVDEAGNFVAGWKLSDQQVANLFRTGNIQ